MEKRLKRDTSSAILHIWKVYLKDFSYNFDEGLFFKLVMTRAIYFNSIPENFQYLYGFRVIVLKLLL